MTVRYMSVVYIESAFIHEGYVRLTLISMYIVIALLHCLFGSGAKYYNWLYCPKTWKIPHSDVMCNESCKIKMYRCKLQKTTFTKACVYGREILIKKFAQIKSSPVQVWTLAIILLTLYPWKKLHCIDALHFYHLCFQLF